MKKLKPMISLFLIIAIGLVFLESSANKTRDMSKQLSNLDVEALTSSEDYSGGLWLYDEVNDEWYWVEYSE